MRYPPTAYRPRPTAHRPRRTDALHGDRTLQGSRRPGSLSPGARWGSRHPGWVALRRELGGSQLRPLLPADGVRRRTPLAAVGPRLARPGRIRDRPRGTLGRDARNNRAAALSGLGALALAALGRAGG